MTRAATVGARRTRAHHTTLSSITGRCDPLEDLSYQICHELRTPLNAVIGFSDMMRSELLGPIGNARYREYLDHISSSAQRMLRAADETLSITSLLAAPKPVADSKPFNLAAAVSQATALATSESSDDLPSVELEICPRAEVWGDDETMIAALAHLFRAAVITNPDAGAIVVTGARLNYDRLALTIRTAEQTSTVPAPGQHNANHDTPEGKMLIALAVSMLAIQGIEVENHAVPGSGCRMTIEFELSSQQALAL